MMQGFVPKVERAGTWPMW